MSKFIPVIVLALVVAALVCQIPAPRRYTIIEGNAAGTQYQNPGLQNDPGAMARQNAAEISVLQKKVSQYGNIIQELNDLSANVHKTATGVAKVKATMAHCKPPAS